MTQAATSYAEQLHLEHLARQRRIHEAARRFEESRAVKSVVNEDNSPAPCKNDANHKSSSSGGEWRDRQIDRFKEPWFKVVDEITSRNLASIGGIQRAVCRHYKLSMRDMSCARRTANVVRPRQVAMYLAKTLTLRSLPEIGRRFGGRDHTTVLHAVRKITGLRESDKELAAEIEAIERKLGVSDDEKADSFTLPRHEAGYGQAEAAQPPPHRLAEPVA